jgi:hypothetical protein
VNHFDQQPPQPYFTPARVDALPMSPGNLAPAYREGDLIYQKDSAGRRWRIEWDHHEGRWCKRVFTTY